MNIEVISNFDDFAKLHSIWNPVLEQSGVDKIFMTHEWFDSWWQAFGKGKELFILLVKENGEIVGIAPLMKNKCTVRGLPVRSIEFIENDDSPGCGFIVKEDIKHFIATIFLFLLQDTRDWDVIYLKNMFQFDVCSLLTELLDKEQKKYLLSNGLHSPYIKAESDWDTYLKNLSPKSRKTIRNICNRMNKTGDITVENKEEAESIADIIAISTKAWKFRKGLSFINNKDRTNFFNLLSNVAQKNKWLSIWCLYKDKAPVAYEYHLKYKKTDTALLSEFDSNYRDYSPGAYLDYQIIKSLFNDGIHEYNMCGDLDMYKSKWTKNVRLHNNITLFNDAAYPRLLYFLETRPVRLIKRARDLLNKQKKLN